MRVGMLCLKVKLLKFEEKPLKILFRSKRECKEKHLLCAHCQILLFVEKVVTIRVVRLRLLIATYYYDTHLE